LIIFRNNVKYLNIFYIFKIFIEKFGTKCPVCLILLYQSAETWGNSLSRKVLWNRDFGIKDRLKTGFLFRIFLVYTVGWWNFWQTCPLVSGVGITGQTQHRADVTVGKADQGW